MANTKWVVVVGSGCWAKCYGLFDSYDAAMAWVRANQYDADTAAVYPVTDVLPEIANA